MEQLCSLSAWMGVRSFTVPINETALNALRASLECFRRAAFNTTDGFIAELQRRYAIEWNEAGMRLMFNDHGLRSEGGYLVRGLCLAGVALGNVVWGERLWIQARFPTDEVFVSEEIACALLEYGIRFDRWGGPPRPTCFCFHGAPRTSEPVRVVSGEAARLLGLIGPMDSSVESSNPKEFARIGDHISLRLRDTAERQHRVEVVYV